MESLGYYMHCDLFEYCDQEQLIYLFGVSQAFLKTRDWLTKELKISDESFNRQLYTYCQHNELISLKKLITNKTPNHFI